MGKERELDGGAALSRVKRRAGCCAFVPSTRQVTPATAVTSELGVCRGDFNGTKMQKSLWVSIVSRAGVQRRTGCWAGDDLPGLKLLAAGQRRSGIIPVCFHLLHYSDSVSRWRRSWSRRVRASLWSVPAVWQGIVAELGRSLRALPWEFSRTVSLLVSGSQRW